SFATESLVLGTILSLLLVIVIALFIQRSIVGPLNEFMVLARGVGEGDLTQRTRVVRRDELGELAGYLDRMVTGLKDVAKQSALVAENLSAATSEILASAQQQAAGTAGQAAAVAQANASMGELSQSGAQISDRAKQVASAAELVSGASNSG